MVVHLQQAVGEHVVIEVVRSHTNPEQKPPKDKERPTEVVHHWVCVWFSFFLPRITHLSVFPKDFHLQGRSSPINRCRMLTL